MTARRLHHNVREHEEAMPRGIYKRPSLRERFDAKWVEDRATGCHVWTAGHYSDGYGSMWVAGRSVHAQRVAWELGRGPIPDGLHVMHVVCDTPACVNVAHLCLGTNAENVADMVAKGRQSRGAEHSAATRASGRHAARCPRGERVASAKLSPEKVVAMRMLYARGGVTHADLARQFGVIRQCISLVLSGKTWGHVP